MVLQSNVFVGKEVKNGRARLYGHWLLSGDGQSSGKGLLVLTRIQQATQRSYRGATVAKPPRTTVHI